MKTTTWTTLRDVRAHIEELMGTEATTEIAAAVTDYLREDDTITYDGREYEANLDRVDLWAIADALGL